MSNTLARLRVLANAAPTFLVIAAVVVTAVSTEIADQFPGSAATWATKAGGWVLAAIGAATAIVRRVAPVLPAERGLLEPPAKTDAPADAGESVTEVLLAVFLVIVIVYVLTRLV